MKFTPSLAAINRPASVYIFMIILAVMGFNAYRSLPRESAPDIQIPILIITIPYPGSSPEDVEALITRKVEPELQRINNLKKMSSTSTEGAALITLKFHLGTDISEARTKVREALDSTKADLPSDAEDPIIQEVNLSEQPIMMVNLSGHYDLFQLKKIAENLKDRFETIPGVLEVKRAGGLEREVKVEVDPTKLNYYQLDLNQVSNTIINENASIPAGNLTVGRMKYLIRVPSEVKGPAEIRKLVITAPGQVPVFIGDVAKVSFGFKEVSSRSRLNGMSSISLSIAKRSGENLVRIADQVKKIIVDEKARFGGRLTIQVLNDQSKKIRSLVSDLENNIYTGLIFVVVVLFLVMGLRTSLFIGAAIPLSMLLSFIVLSWVGITLNFVVLFSLILALGMLVDNAIVVVENIYRHLESGLSTKEAAAKGVSEVAIPVISSTATTLAAFFPLLFMPGISGEFMSYLPKTLIITLTASLFVGLIFNPVFCATLMKPHKKNLAKDVQSLVRSGRLLGFYHRSLVWSLGNRWKVIFLVLALWVGIVTFYFTQVFPKAGVEFFPETEPSSATIHIQAPFGSTLATSDRLSRQVEKKLQPYAKDLEAIVTNVGQKQGFSGSKETHESNITLSFPDWQGRERSPNSIIKELHPLLGDLSGALLRLTKPSGGPPTGRPVNLELSGPNSVELKRLSRLVQAKIVDIPGLVNLQDNMTATRSEIKILLDREKLGTLGLNSRQVARLIRTAFNGRKVSTWRQPEEEYDIVVRLAPKFRASIHDLSGLYLKTPSGESVSLSELAVIKTTVSKGSIRHIDTKTVVTISGDAEGIPGPSLLKKVQARLEGYPLPPGYQLKYTGENESRKEMQAYLGKSFLIAIFLIFLILVTQFNSLVLPFIILSSVFLSLMGVFLGWVIHQSPISIMMGGIGIISLAGVVVNNAIVLIDYVGQLKNEGKTTSEALVLAGMLRMRPVMMTAITTILGLLPIVLGLDINFYRPGIIAFGSDSAQMWQPMARSVVYGLAVATLLTLIVVPVIYSLLASGKGALRRLKNRVTRTLKLGWLGPKMGLSSVVPFKGEEQSPEGATKRGRKLKLPGWLKRPGSDDVDS